MNLQKSSGVDECFYDVLPYYHKILNSAELANFNVMKRKKKKDSTLPNSYKDGGLKDVNVFA